MKSCIVIGGGIVGLATAYQLLGHKPGLKLTVLEKEAKVGQHQTGNNSGVLHAGLYYKPGSAKARMAVGGIKRMVAFCREHSIPHEICGKLVVATNEGEVARLENLYERGQANGLQGVRRLNREEMREIEPHVAGIAALRVPEEGIVDYEAVCNALSGEIEKQGGFIRVHAKANKITRVGSSWKIETPAGEFEADFIVNCAGLHCDRVSELTGEKREVRIVPFRGEYFKIRPERQYLVKNLIYPVPDPVYPFLGVHFTRLIHGGIEAGPNAVLAFAREGYKYSDVNLADLFDALTFQGFWKFAGRHMIMCRDELIRSMFKKIFCRSLQKLVPEIQVEDLAPGGAGVRAQAMDPEGNLVQDFRFIEREGVLHVLNAPSPAATASLAIGDEICAKIGNALD